MTRDHLILDRPCTYCQVLELKDLQHGGRMRHDQCGKPYVDFGEARGWEADAEGFWNNDLRLGYRRHDVLPSLPELAATALQGCAFCKVLRDDLISVLVKLWNKEETNTTGLTITEVIYRFRGDKNSPRVGLDTLYVFFVVDSRVGMTEYSLQYRFHAYPSDPCAQWFKIDRYPVTNEQLSAPALDRMNMLIGRSLQESPIKNNIQERFLPTRFLPTRFLPTRFLPTRFLPTRFLPTRFLPTRFLPTRFLPTRLLDLDSKCTSGLRLVITKKDPEIKRLDRFHKRYAALSYCWGSASEARLQLITTHLTLNSHLLGIQLDRVPKTISDAIRLCRGLGIRYLWVDALCVIQGDDEDWNKESFKMSQIYSNCFLTLCVAQGDSCSSGFLEPLYAPPTVQINFRSEVNRSISGSIYVRMLFPPNKILDTHSKKVSSSRTHNVNEITKYNIDRAAWAQRGWTFQEDQLSPRKLYFGELMFYFGSKTLHEAADGTKFSRQSFLEIEMSLGETLVHWYTMMEAYTERKITFESDRFPAISALARSICDRFPDQKYLAGLWESDLHRGLLWTTKSRIALPHDFKLPVQAYIAPSWSWACRPCAVTWIRLITEGSSAKFSSELILKNADVPYDQANPYGRVSRARLSIRSKVFKLPRFTDTRVDEPGVRQPRFFLAGEYVFNYIFRPENDDFIAYLRPDWDNSFLHDEQLSLLLVSKSTPVYHSQFSSVGDEMLGIIIRPIPGMENEYEKLGVWYSENEGDYCGGTKFWEKISMQELTLV
ncbi:heterokaryon incompatibility protein-domain-containing protein [Xylaria flabelliformis]|nr:heterokaryon incompatibility protein-domain-containing protein [Xylaria flabelliformis]